MKIMNETLHRLSSLCSGTNRGLLAVLLMGGAILLTACRHRSSEPDVFYILSTEVLHSYDEDSTEVFNARLLPEDTLALYAEREFVRAHYATGLRFFAPYYEQFTFAAISLPTDSFAPAYQHAKMDIMRRFNDYMTCDNGGRDFVLVGFSQGAMLALDLLKEMTDEQYAHCRAVYMMGYRLSEQDLAHERVIPATDALSGNVISFNSVMRTDAIWPFVAADAATCINPLNWRTDTTPAMLVYEGDTAWVRVDQQTQQLLVTGLNENKYRFPLTVPGNLHHWDLLFYSNDLRENISQRSR